MVGNCLRGGKKSSTMIDTHKEIETHKDEGYQGEEDDLMLERDENGDYIVRQDSAYRVSPPETVQGVPRLSQDLQVLTSFFAPSSPPWRFVRGSKVLQVLYGFADASKSGFGTSIQSGESIWY